MTLDGAFGLNAASAKAVTTGHEYFVHNKVTWATDQAEVALARFWGAMPYGIRRSNDWRWLDFYMQRSPEWNVDRLGPSADEAFAAVRAHVAPSAIGAMQELARLDPAFARVALNKRLLGKGRATPMWALPTLDLMLRRIDEVAMRVPLGPDGLIADVRRCSDQHDDPRGVPPLGVIPGIDVVHDEQGRLTGRRSWRKGSAFNSACVLARHIAPNIEPARKRDFEAWQRANESMRKREFAGRSFAASLFAEQYTPIDQRGERITYRMTGWNSVIEDDGTVTGTFKLVRPIESGRQYFNPLRPDVSPHGFDLLIPVGLHADINGGQTRHLSLDGWVAEISHSFPVRGTGHWMLRSLFEITDSRRTSGGSRSPIDAAFDMQNRWRQRYAKLRSPVGPDRLQSSETRMDLLLEEAASAVENGAYSWLQPVLQSDTPDTSSQPLADITGWTGEDVLALNHSWALAKQGGQSQLESNGHTHTTEEAGAILDSWYAAMYDGPVFAFHRHEPRMDTFSYVDRLIGVHRDKLIELAKEQNPSAGENWALSYLSAERSTLLKYVVGIESLRYDNFAERQYSHNGPSNRLFVQGLPLNTAYKGNYEHLAPFVWETIEEANRVRMRLPEETLGEVTPIANVAAHRQYLRSTPEFRHLIAEVGSDPGTRLRALAAPTSAFEDSGLDPEDAEALIVERVDCAQVAPNVHFQTVDDEYRTTRPIGAMRLPEDWVVEQLPVFTERSIRTVTAHSPFTPLPFGKGPRLRVILPVGVHVPATSNVETVRLSPDMESFVVPSAHGPAGRELEAALPKPPQFLPGDVLASDYTTHPAFTDIRGGEERSLDETRAFHREQVLGHNVRPAPKPWAPPANEATPLTPRPGRGGVDDLPRRVPVASLAEARALRAQMKAEEARERRASPASSLRSHDLDNGLDSAPSPDSTPASTDLPDTNGDATGVVHTKADPGTPTTLVESPSSEAGSRRRSPLAPHASNAHAGTRRTPPRARPVVHPSDAPPSPRADTTARGARSDDEATRDASHGQSVSSPPKARPVAPPNVTGERGPSPNPGATRSTPVRTDMPGIGG